MQDAARSPSILSENVDRGRNRVVADEDLEESIPESIRDGIDGGDNNPNKIQPKLGRRAVGVDFKLTTSTGTTCDFRLAWVVLAAALLLVGAVLQALGATMLVDECLGRFSETACGASDVAVGSRVFLRNCSLPLEERALPATFLPDHTKAPHC